LFESQKPEILKWKGSLKIVCNPKKLKSVPFFVFCNKESESWKYSTDGGGKRVKRHFGTFALKIFCLYTHRYIYIYKRNAGVLFFS